MLGDEPLLYILLEAPVVPDASNQRRPHMPANFISKFCIIGAAASSPLPDLGLARALLVGFNEH